MAVIHELNIDVRLVPDEATVSAAASILNLIEPPEEILKESTVVKIVDRGEYIGMYKVISYDSSNPERPKIGLERIGDLL